MTSELSTIRLKRFGTIGGNADANDLATDFVVRLMTRGSHRSYSDRVVDPDLLRTISEASLCASSKSDFQQVAMVHIAEKSLQREIGALMPSMPWVAAAPEFIVFCGDARRIVKIGAMRGLPVNPVNLEALFNATVDAALVMQTFILAAESLGLGCCPISAVRNNADDVARLLQLPELVFPVAGLCIGYPKEATRLTPRLSLAVTLHTNRYDDSGLEAEIARYDEIRSSKPETVLALSPNGLARGHWSEEKARQSLELEVQKFPDFVRRHGFSF